MEIDKAPNGRARGIADLTDLDFKTRDTGRVSSAMDIAQAMLESMTELSNQEVSEIIVQGSIMEERDRKGKL